MPQRIVRRTKIAEWTGIIALVVALASGITLYNLQQRNHRALCGFKASLVSQRDNSQKILDNHPKLRKIKLGEVIYTRNDIKQAIDRQTKTIESLHLSC
jgi:hypothetical protein